MPHLGDTIREWKIQLFLVFINYLCIQKVII